MTSDFQFVFLPLDIVKRSKHKKIQDSKLMQSDICALWGNACFFGISIQVPPPPFYVMILIFLSTQMHNTEIIFIVLKLVA